MLWVILLTMGVAACGDDADSSAGDETTSSTAVSTTTPESSTTTTTSETPTTTAATTTTTTTIAPDPDAWTVDGATLVAGECFLEPDSRGGGTGSQGGEIGGVVRMSTGAATPTEVVSCDGSHAGEVVATGSACPVGSLGEKIDLTHLTKGLDPTQVAAVFAAYVGVDAADFGAWMTEHDLVLRFLRQAGDDMVITDTLCFLGAADGDLIGSYRASG